MLDGQVGKSSLLYAMESRWRDQVLKWHHTEQVKIAAIMHASGASFVPYQVDNRGLYALYNIILAHHALSTTVCSQSWSRNSVAHWK